MFEVFRVEGFWGLRFSGCSFFLGLRFLGFRTFGFSVCLGCMFQGLEVFGYVGFVGF